MRDPQLALAERSYVHLVKTSENQALLALVKSYGSAYRAWLEHLNADSASDDILLLQAEATKAARNVGQYLSTPGVESADARAWRVHLHASADYMVRMMVPYHQPPERPADVEVWHDGTRWVYRTEEMGHSLSIGERGLAQGPYGSRFWSSSSYNRGRDPRLPDGGTIGIHPSEHRMPSTRFTYGNDFRSDRWDSLEWGSADGITIEALVPGTVVFDTTREASDKTLYLENDQALTLRGLRAVAGRTAGFMTERPGSSRWGGRDRAPRFRDTRLEDFEVWIERFAKWGFLSYELGWSYGPGYGFVWDGGGVRGHHDLLDEHCAYLHNMVGKSLFQNLLMGPSRRTALHFTNRPHEGLTVDHEVDIFDCHALNNCLENGGGGHALTIKGGRGRYRVRNLKVQMGPSFGEVGDRARNITGAVMLQAGEYDPDTGQKTDDESKWQHIRKVEFEGLDSTVEGHLSEGSARRANVVLDWCDEVSLIGSRITSTEGSRPALVIGRNNGRVVLDARNQVPGVCVHEGEEFDNYHSMLVSLEQQPNVTIVNQ